MSKGEGKQVEELNICTSGDVEKWAASEGMQESEGSGKVVWPWRAVQSSGVQRKGRTAEGRQTNGHLFQEPKAVSSHREEAAADPTQAPFWQTDHVYSANIQCPDFDQRMSGKRLGENKRCSQSLVRLKCPCPPWRGEFHLRTDGYNAIGMNTCKCTHIPASMADVFSRVALDR